MKRQRIIKCSLEKHEMLSFFLNPFDVYTQLHDLLPWTQTCCSFADAVYDVFGFDWIKIKTWVLHPNSPIMQFLYLIS